MAALARRGLAVHLVTGDNWRTARAIAEQLAIVNVCAECLPGGKADKMRVRPPCMCHHIKLVSGQLQLPRRLVLDSSGSTAQKLSCMPKPGATVEPHVSARACVQELQGSGDAPDP